MFFYICRHGTAQDQADSGEDEDRALTPEGIRKFRRAARGFARLTAKEPALTRIFTSPLRRARETAEIMREALMKCHPAPELVITSALGPPGDLTELLAQVAKTDQAVMAVGHEPILSDWIGTLCFDGSGRCELKKGAIAAIEMEAGARRNRGTLLWLMGQGLLRRM